MQLVLNNFLKSLIFVWFKIYTYIFFNLKSKAIQNNGYFSTLIHERYSSHLNK